MKKASSFSFWSPESGEKLDRGYYSILWWADASENTPGLTTTRRPRVTMRKFIWLLVTVCIRKSSISKNISFQEVDCFLNIFETPQTSSLLFEGKVICCFPPSLPDCVQILWLFSNFWWAWELYTPVLYDLLNLFFSSWNVLRCLGPTC